VERSPATQRAGEFLRRATSAGWRINLLRGCKTKEAIISQWGDAVLETTNCLIVQGTCYFWPPKRRLVRLALERVRWSFRAFAKMTRFGRMRGIGEVLRKR